MIEKRLQTLEQEIVRLQIIMQEHTDMMQLLVKTNPDTAAFKPDVIRRRESRFKKGNHTKQDLIEVFQEYCQKLGNDKGAALLEVYGVKAVVKLEEQVWAEVIKHMQTDMS